MPTALVFNPGSNSLKFEVIQCETGQHVASRAKKLASAALDSIGKQPKLSVYKGREVISEENTDAENMGRTVGAVLAWLGKDKAINEAVLAERIVHPNE